MVVFEKDIELVTRPISVCGHGIERGLAFVVRRAQIRAKVKQKGHRPPVYLAGILDRTINGIVDGDVERSTSIRNGFVQLCTANYEKPNGVQVPIFGRACERSPVAAYSPSAININSLFQEDSELPRVAVSRRRDEFVLQSLRCHRY